MRITLVSRKLRIRHKVQSVTDDKKYNSQLTVWYYNVMKQQPTWQTFLKGAKLNQNFDKINIFIVVKFLSMTRKTENIQFLTNKNVHNKVLVFNLKFQPLVL